MGKIVAIGGGENGHHNTAYETAVFDKEIIKLTGKSKPNFLFIGLANQYSEYYYKVMKGIYGALYGCVTDYLTDEEHKSYDIAKSKIKWADIIYVGGGNTLKLMNAWRKYGIDELLLEAFDKDKVLCGVSAGGICWCDYGNSDSRKFTSNSDKLIKVKGLGFVNILFCPHIITEPERVNDLKRMMKSTYKIPAVALDKAALEIVGNEYRVLAMNEDAIAEKCYWKNGRYIRRSIISNTFKSIEELYRRDSYDYK